MNSARRVTWLAIGAAILALAAGAYLFLRPEVHRTGVGGYKRIVLDDDSVIELNANTEVRVAVWPKRTVCFVHGEASFDIEPDARTRFVVKLANGTLRASSGRFNVQQSSDAIVVLAAEGDIAVDGNGVRLEQATPELIEQRLQWMHQSRS